MVGQSKYINIVGLINFLDGTRNDAIQYLSKFYLDDEQVAACNYETTTGNLVDDVTAMAILIFSQNPRKMHLIEGFESVIRSKFIDYVMSIVDVSDDDISVDKIQLKEILSRGVDYNKIDQNFVQEALKKVDFEDNSGFTSRLLDSFIDDDYHYIFVLREYKRSKLRQIEETNVGNEVELIILRFNSDLKLCSIKSHSNNEENALKICNHILKKCAGKYFEYIKPQLYTSEDKIRNFLHVAIDKNIPHIQLYEIYFENFPVIGSPIMIIRSHDKDKSLGNTIEELRDVHNFKLLEDDINLIRSVKIAYKIKDKENDKYQIMNLSITEKADKEYLVVHSIYGMSIFKRDILKKELNNYGLIVYG